MARKDKDASINYAGPGARVGIQAQNVVITGGIRAGKDAQADEADEDED